MAVRNYDAPESTDGNGDYLEAEGRFHFLVEEMRDGKNIKGDVFKGFTFEARVLSGDHVDKKTSLSLRDPEPTHKDGGDFCKRCQTAFFIATDLMAPTQLGKPVACDPDKSKGMQFVADVRFSKDKDGKLTKFLEINGSHIYHVDDPRVADVPKDAEALSIIDDEHRHKPEYFEPLLKKAAPAKQPPKQQDNYDDL